MKALILAGGFGTRLKGVLGEETPKSMALIAGKPFLEHQIQLLKKFDIKDIVLAVHHKGEYIKSYFGTGRKFGINLTYSEEDTPLGTAGAIKNAEKYIDDTFFVLNGDSYSQINLNDFLNFHKAKKSISTIGLTKIDPKDSINFGKVNLEDNKITSFSEKGDATSELVNCGSYLFEPKIFDYIEGGKTLSIERDVFPLLATNGMLYGYQYNDYFVDIGRPETYNKFKRDIINKLMLKENSLIKDAINKITSNGIDLGLIVDNNEKLLGILDDKLIKNFILRGGRLEDPVGLAMSKSLLTAKLTDSKFRINQIFSSGVHKIPILDEDGRIIDVEFYVEEIKTEEYPIIRGKAPLRISFGGGGTDLPYFFEENGGTVISSTIDKYCRATVLKRADSKIIINSVEGELIINSVNDIKYDGKQNLLKAVINIIRPKFGFEIYLHNDMPPGSGLGSSASLAVLVASIIGELEGRSYDPNKIADIALRAEREELKNNGGLQDQYAIVTGGFNFIEFQKNKSPIIHPLRLKEDFIEELQAHSLLCYTGENHSSGNVHEDQERRFKENSETQIEKLMNLKKIAVEIKNSLLSRDLSDFGRLLNESWKIKKTLSSRISTNKIDELYEVGVKNGAYGG